MKKIILGMSAAILSSFFVFSGFCDVETKRISKKSSMDFWKQKEAEGKQKPEYKPGLRRNTPAQNKKLEELRTRKSEWASLKDPKKKEAFEAAIELQKQAEKSGGYLYYEDALNKLREKKKIDEETYKALLKDEAAKKAAYEQVLDELENHPKYKEAEKKYGKGKERSNSKNRVSNRADLHNYKSAADGY